MTRSARDVDALDAALIRLLTDHPRMSVLDLSRQLNVARGTAQARLDRLIHSGIIRNMAPSIDTEALGYPVTAFVTLEVQQHSFEDLLAGHLAAIPQVLEAHTITGPGDIMVRCVARSNLDLQKVIDTINSHTSVLRASTVIALCEHVAHRVSPLLDHAAETTDPDHRNLRATNAAASVTT